MAPVTDAAASCARHVGQIPDSGLFLRFFSDTSDII